MQENNHINIKSLEERIVEAQQHCLWLSFKHNLPKQVKENKKISGFHPLTPTQKMGLGITAYAEKRLKATMAW